MGRDPGSLWSALRENGTQGSHVKDKFIVHSTGDRGSASAIYNYFNRTDVVVESTFAIGLSPDDPTRQLLDSAQTADANLGANQSGIAVEVVGTENDPFTEWQMSELIRLGRWAPTVHPIPARICPSATGGGYGWHVMFGAPGPWTPVAKSCPGKVRIKQLLDRVFPAIFNGTEDDMANSDEILRYVQSIDNRVRGTDPNVDSFTLLGMKVDAVAGLLVGGNTNGRNNFHWLAEQFASAIAAIPGAQVDLAALRAAIAESVTFTEETIAKAAVDGVVAKLSD